MYATLAADGSTSSWTTNANSMPANIENASTVVANGYVYVMGGRIGSASGSGVDTVYYTSTSRLKFGGSLDLVGLGGEFLGDVGGTGGGLVANYGNFVGDLQVQGQASFATGVSIDKGLTVNDSAYFKSFTPNSDSVADIDSDGLEVAFTQSDDNDATDINSALKLTVTSSSGDADSLYGLNIANITGGSASESAILIGTGWDNDIHFNKATPVIKLGATDNTSSLSIVDNAATPNTLLLINDVSTAFGATVGAGAFTDYNSFWGDEFNRVKAAASADVVGANTSTGFGDLNAWGAYELSATECEFTQPVDTINGTAILQANAAANECAYIVDDSINDIRAQFSATNLPTMLFKVRPGQADANSFSYIGLADTTDAIATTPANFLGFSSDGTTTWTGKATSSEASGGTSTVTCTGATISTTNYALLKVEVVSTSQVNFYADENVSDGIQWRSCGSASTENNIPDVALAAEIHWQERAGGTGGATSILATDFFRIWQYDPPVSATDAQDQELAVDQPNPLTIESAASNFDARQALADLMTVSEDMAYDSVQRLDTQVLYASKGVVTPELAADRVETNLIEAATGSDIQLKLGEGGKFVIAGPNGEDAITFDALGNAHFAGTVTANKVKANQIEGLEILTDQISALTAAVQGPTLQTGDSDTNSSDNQVLGAQSGVTQIGKVQINSATVTLDLNVNGSLVADGGLTVNGLAEFNGESIFDQLVTFNGPTDFKGRVTFNNDSGGFALIKQGYREVRVEFDQPYADKPVVTVNVNDGQFVQYAYKDLTVNGFTIILKDPATQDTNFSWTALSVKDAKTVQAP